VTEEKCFWDYKQATCVKLEKGEKECEEKKMEECEASNICEWFAFVLFVVVMNGKIFVKRCFFLVSHILNLLLFLSSLRRSYGNASCDFIQLRDRCEKAVTEKEYGEGGV
jgi:hypothetical protein